MSSLQDVFGLLKHAARSVAQPLNPDPPKIIEVLAALPDGRVVKPPRPRPDVGPKWLAAIERSDFSTITQQDIRFLYWEKDVVLTKQFVDQLFERKLTIRRSAIKGFIYALALRWDEVGRGVLPLQTYDESLSRLTTSDFLDRVRPFILHPKGHDQFAEQVISRKTSLTALFSEIFGLVIPSSSYTDEVLRLVSARAYKSAWSPDRAEREWFYASVLSQLTKGDLLERLEQIVSGIVSANAEDAKEDLKGFILGHQNLGDPRLPGFEGNWDKNAPVTLAVIEWLSQSDITFFFELFFPNQRDVQGRKQFWLRYAHKIRGTRVIVADSDSARLKRQLMQLDPKKINKHMFGRLRRSNQLPTAFMMDFGKLWVVEFSGPGHACYFYSLKSNFQFSNRAVFWDTKEFSLGDLKDQERCSDRLSHFQGWESKFANILATHGLRPKAPRYG
jgi:hypothetical protein